MGLKIRKSLVEIIYIFFLTEVIEVEIILK